MCSLSFVAGDHGYLLAMNRDEKMARGPGNFPKLRDLGGTQAVFPAEEGGGTWIGANQHGLTLALLNWNEVVQTIDLGAVRRSRGLLIPALISSMTAGEFTNALCDLNVREHAPFRLVAVFGAEKELVEWRWDGYQLSRQAFPWHSRHWFSSSLSDRCAEQVRAAVCADAWDERDSGSVSWLRRLHASHASGPGPFSLCVHRAEVATLSYTEVICTPAKVSMRHSAGSPCRQSERKTLEIHRRDQAQRCPEESHAS